MDITKLKVGDHIMYDRGTTNYSTFAIVEGIEKRPMNYGKEKIILNLKHVYKRQRITEDGTMNENIFLYEHHDDLYIAPDSRETIASKLYKITKAEYNSVEKVVRALFKAQEKAMDVTRELYFEKKRQARNN